MFFVSLRSLMKRWIPAALAALLAVLPLAAQTGGEGAESLEEVTVSGTRVPLTLHQSARMVTVLDTLLIRSAPVQTVNDLLKCRRRHQYRHAQRGRVRCRPAAGRRLLGHIQRRHPRPSQDRPLDQPGLRLLRPLRRLQPQRGRSPECRLQHLQGILPGRV